MDLTAPKVIGLGLAVLLIVANESGYRLKQFVDRRGDARVDGGDNGAGYLLSAALGLLGLLIAFTFSMAADRYDARRILVRDEANAIGTAFLRTQLLDAPAAPALGRMWLAYGEARLAVATAGEDAVAAARAEAVRDDLQRRIWRETVRQARVYSAAPLAATIVESANAAFDASASRRASLEGRVPSTILQTVIAYAVVSAVIMGYVLAADGARHRTASVVLLVLVAASIALILDLDRPRAGAIRVSQAPLERTVADMRQALPD